MRDTAAWGRRTLHAMRIMFALAAGLAAIAALAGPRTDVAIACSCEGVNPKRDLRKSDAAFVGIVLSHRRVRANEPVLSSPADPTFWTFSVERAVKGKLPRRLVVTTASSGAACGLELEQGQRTGLLLRRDGSEYESGLCYQADPDVLARYALPRARIIASPADEEAWRWWPFALAGGTLCLLAVAVTFGFAKRR